MPKSRYHCDICEIDFDRNSKLKRHLETAKHKLGLEFLLNVRTESDVNGGRHSKHGSVKLLNNTNDTPSVSQCQTQSTDSFDENEDRNDSDGGDEVGGDFETTNYDWYPFQNKLNMLLYTMMHSPTHHISDEVARFVWFILEEANVPNLPTFSYIKNLKFGDEDAREMVKKGIDGDGVPYYFISPTEVAKLALANPEISKDIVRYPWIGSASTIAEQFEGMRCKEMKSHWAPCLNGDLFTGDFVRSEEVYGQIMGFYDNLEHDTIMAEVDIFVSNGHPLIMEYGLIDKCLVKIGKKKKIECSRLRPFSVTEFQLKEIKDGQCRHLLQEHQTQHSKPVVSLPINLFIDDTSSNVSRRWLPLHCIQMQLAGIPLKYRQKESFSHFVAASEKTGAMTLSTAVIDDILTNHTKLVDAYDASIKREVFVRPNIAMVVADFNMLAATCNHMGAAAKKFCPKCHADRDHACVKGVQRKPSETQRTVERLNLRSSESARKKLRKQTGVKEFDNPFWKAIDPHRDVPSGVLHLFHLGVTKHLLKHCLATLNERQLQEVDLFPRVLDSSQQIQFEIAQNIDSRQGKDMKQCIPIAPFIFAYAGLNENLLEMVCLLAKLNRMVHQHSYNHQEIADLEATIQQYLTCVEEKAPTLKQKVKTHLLTHMVSELKRHGPILCYSEDVFEKRHGLIRAKLFNQENQLARSRDTAIIFSENMKFQHILMGGFFKNGNIWGQSSILVQQMSKVPEVAKYLGSYELEKKQPGTLLKPKRKNNFKVMTHSLNTFHPENVLIQGLINCRVTSPDTCGSFIKYQAMMPETGERVSTGSSILYHNMDDEMQIGIFSAGYLIIQKSNRYQLVAIQPAVKQPTVNEKVGCCRDKRG